MKDIILVVIIWFHHLLISSSLFCFIIPSPRVPLPGGAALFMHCCRDVSLKVAVAPLEHNARGWVGGVVLPAPGLRGVQGGGRPRLHCAAGARQPPAQHEAVESLPHLGRQVAPGPRQQGGHRDVDRPGRPVGPAEARSCSRTYSQRSPLLIQPSPQDVQRPPSLRDRTFWCTIW